MKYLDYLLYCLSEETGKVMQTAAAVRAQLQADCELIKATPDIKTGRVLSVDELENSDVFYLFNTYYGSK